MRPPAQDAPPSNLQTFYDVLSVMLGLAFLGRVAYIAFGEARVLERPLGQAPDTKPFGAVLAMLLLGTALAAWIVVRMRARWQRRVARRERANSLGPRETVDRPQK
jgi:hypothetical protein